MGDHISNVNLPPGFRFQPTDEELVVHFLHRKAALLPCHPDVIPDLDLCPIDPWELEGKALAGGNKWYYFSRRAQDRVTGNGYWKPLGVDEPIVTGTGRRVGMKKHFVFYVGEAPGGTKSNWIMHEYRLLSGGSSSSSSNSRGGGSGSSGARSSSSKGRGRANTDYSNWVLCRVYERDGDGDDDDSNGADLSCLDEVFLSLDDLDEITN